MPRIDAFLHQLLAYEADALLIEAGDNLYLLKGDQRMPLMQVRPGSLANEHVMSLVAEMAPPAERAAIEAGTRTSFLYTHSEGQFRVEFAAAGGRFFVRIRDERAAAPAAPPPVRADERDDAADPGTDDPAGPSPVDDALRALVELGGSDLLVCADRIPTVRIDGELQQLVGMEPTEAYALQKLLESMLPARVASHIDTVPDARVCVERAGARFRVSIYRDRRGLGATFRLLPRSAPAAADIDLPEDLLEHLVARRGLVILAGAHASGRTTTAAAILDWVNAHRAMHIVTIEDPVEVVLEPKRSVIHQRDAQEHGGGLARALGTLAHADADVIYVDGARTARELALMLDLADAGKLVIVTWTGTEPGAVVEQMLSVLERERHGYGRSLFARSLCALLIQTLSPRLGGGRVASFDVMFGGPHVSSIINRGELSLLRAVPTTLIEEPHASPEGSHV